MDIGEEVTALSAFMTEDPLCQKEKEPEARGWKCRIGKPGSPGDLDTPTAERLYENMKAAGASIPADPSKLDGFWDLDKCTPNSFPFQSHHLIPKMHLPKHDVCVWLAKNAANKQWMLTESTNYDTDNSKNGLALPFASNTQQWKKASSASKKDDICNKMMSQTGLQLHQGSHTYDDYGEQDNLHADEQPGYLGAVDELLKVVNGQALGHVQVCEKCKKNNSKPWKVRPLERVVSSVHQVSSLMGSMISSKKRFVSERAAKYFGSGKPK